MRMLQHTSPVAFDYRHEVESLDEGPPSAYEDSIAVSSITGAADLDASSNIGAPDHETSSNMEISKLETTINTSAADQETSSNTAAVDHDASSDMGAANKGATNSRDDEMSMSKRRRSFD